MDTDDDVQAVKAARNQALCREVNVQIRNVEETAGHVAFLCECADLDCAEPINLSVGEYERIRNPFARFTVALGHVYLEVETVVEATDGYAVVQRRGKAAEISAKLDPRSRFDD